MISKKAQISVIYLGLLVLLSVLFFGFVVAFSNMLKDGSTEDLGNFLIDDVLDRLERNLVEIRGVANQSDSSELVRTFSIPQRIGDESYIISGQGSDIVVSTLGKNALFERRSIYWWDVEINGSVFSGNGEIHLNYSQNTNSVRIS